MAVLLAALLLAAAAPGTAHALTATEVRAALAREFAAAGPSAGAYARDLETGATVFSARPDVPRIPASVEKLFVTAAAFLRFGADGALQTRVVASVPPDAGGVVEGDLVLVGVADPTLGPAGLRRLARGVADAGVAEVTGALVTDSTPGALPAGAGARLLAALRAEGVGVRGGVVSGARPAEGNGVPVAAVTWLPLSRLATRINVPSDNALAERLLQTLGVFGGAANRVIGASVVRDTLDDLGIRPRIVDGSGLSRANRTTPRQVVRLFERLDASEAGPAFRASLAVPGRSGTVRRRMRGTPAAGRCAVKTGTLRSVSALAGVCTTAGGGDVAFAWLMNGANVYTARTVQDRMTALLGRYEGAATSAEEDAEAGSDGTGGAPASAASSPASSST